MTSPYPSRHNGTSDNVGQPWQVPQEQYSQQWQQQSPLQPQSQQPPQPQSPQPVYQQQPPPSFQQQPPLQPQSQPPQQSAAARGIALQRPGGVITAFVILWSGVTLAVFPIVLFMILFMLEPTMHNTIGANMTMMIVMALGLAFAVGLSLAAFNRHKRSMQVLVGLGVAHIVGYIVLLVTALRHDDPTMAATLTAGIMWILAVIIMLVMQRDWFEPAKAYDY